jgi:N-acetyl-1-D-myo-inositol-2-amino-2-deoxy-alpha-D-glucopyranoside deacetylase
VSARSTDRVGVAVAGVTVLATGVIVGVCGTLVHRADVWNLPGGLVLALFAAAVGAVFARAVGDGVGVFLYGLVGLVTCQALTLAGPGGDVLVTGQALSYVWLLGLPLMTVAAAFTPRSWYSDLPTLRPRHTVGRSAND